MCACIVIVTLLICCDVCACFEHLTLYQVSMPAGLISCCLVCQQAANGMVGTTQETARQHQVAACMEAGITHVSAFNAHIPSRSGWFVAE